MFVGGKQGRWHYHWGIPISLSSFFMYICFYFLPLSLSFFFNVDVIGSIMSATTTTTHIRKELFFFCMLRRLLASWCSMVTIGVVIARTQSIVRTTTIAQKLDNNGTKRCHYHHYSLMNFFESPRFYEDLPCFTILGKV